MALILLSNNSDSNECVDGNNDCSEFAQCFDTPDLFGCFCNEGFVGDGRNCTGIISDHA